MLNFNNNKEYFKLITNIELIILKNISKIEKIIKNIYKFCTNNIDNK